MFAQRATRAVHAIIPGIRVYPRYDRGTTVPFFIFAKLMPAGAAAQLKGEYSTIAPLEISIVCFFHYFWVIPTEAVAFQLEFVEVRFCVGHDVSPLVIRAPLNRSSRLCNTTTTKTGVHLEHRCEGPVLDGVPRRV